MTRVALYARVSTGDQDTSRQLEELREHAASEYPDAESEEYTDIISGTEEGDEYRRLWDDIGDSEFDAVVVHEISRLSRLGAGEIAEFIRHSLEHDTAVESLDVGLSIRVDDPDIQQSVYTMVANIMGDLAKIEREQTLRRIRSGIRSARDAGTWTGRPPRGFTVDDDGQLRVDADEFVRIRDALERILAGDQITDVAEASGVPESTLRRLRDDRLELYFAGDADDERVEAALGASDIATVDAPAGASEFDERVREIVREELETETNGE